MHNNFPELSQWQQVKKEWLWLRLKICHKYYFKLFKINFFVGATLFILGIGGVIVAEIFSWSKVLSYNGFYFGMVLSQVYFSIFVPKKSFDSNNGLTELNTQELVWLKDNSSLILLKYVYYYFDNKYKNSKYRLNFNQIISEQFLEYFHDEYKNYIKAQEYASIMALQDNLINLKEEDLLSSNHQNMSSQTGKLL